jgi:PIN domain nuclease of toxin-antitoxin system
VNLLVDTQLLLWTIGQSARVPAAARELIEAASTEPTFSTASVWEIAIKAGLGRDDFRVDPARLRRGLLHHGWSELAVRGTHAVAVAGLPALHKDPFDRLLAAQALSEGLTLLTTDRRLKAYPGPIRLV